MPKPTSAKVITASALIEGDVVYFTAANQWSRHLSDAEVLTGETEAQDRLQRAMSNPAVVGAYLAGVDATGAAPRPAHYREKFRATGPSNYPHGKQESEPRHV